MRDIARPKTTPSAMDTPNESRKMPTPWKICETEKSAPWNCDSVLYRHQDKDIYEEGLILTRT